MKTPFTPEQFFDVFRIYNTTVFPLQILFYALAFFAVYVSFKKIPGSGKYASLILAYLWFWMGGVYHIIFFTAINKAAYIFGAAFMIQAVLIFYFGVYKNVFSFEYSPDAKGVAGLILILYALFLYPLIGTFSGHTYPFSPTFGLPCPTTIFTFGIMLWNRKQRCWPVMVIPIIWSIFGFAAVLQLGVAEDSVLPAAGLISFLFMILTKKDKNHVTL